MCFGVTLETASPLVRAHTQHVLMCVYTCTHRDHDVRVHMHTQGCVCAYACHHKCVWVYTHMGIHMYVCLHNVGNSVACGVRGYTYIRVNICMCVCTTPETISHIVHIHTKRIDVCVCT